MSDNLTKVKMENQTNETLDSNIPDTQSTPPVDGTPTPVDVTDPVATPNTGNGDMPPPKV